jgi:hypothetical protein
MYTCKFPLHPLCKGEALELFSVDRQQISPSNKKVDSLAKMQEFVHSLSCFIHTSSRQVSLSHMEEMDEQYQMNPYPNA